MTIAAQDSSEQLEAITAVIEPRVWFLSAEELAATRVKLSALTRRADKRGFSGQIDLSAQPATRRFSVVAGGPTVTVHGFEVTITGAAPCYAGWRFVAAVDAVGEEVVVRYPPGREVALDHGSLRAGVCDHCHTARSRRTTVLVQHEETGELKQVGRSCLKDFLGWSTLPVFIDDADVEERLGLGLCSGRTGEVDLTSVVVFAWAVVAAYGWTPASAASDRRPSTRDLVGEVVLDGRHADEVMDAVSPHLAEAEEMAPRILADLTAAFTGSSGYEANVAVLLRAGMVDPRRHLGLAVSMVSAWQRLQEGERQKAIAAASAPVRRHVGTVGEKVTLTGTVTTRMMVDGFHWSSPDNVLLILDCGEHLVKVVTAAGWAYDVKQGEVVTVTGTVKAHAEYREVPQTVLTRPRLCADGQAR